MLICLHALYLHYVPLTTTLLFNKYGSSIQNNCFNQNFIRSKIDSTIRMLIQDIQFSKKIIFAQKKIFLESWCRVAIMLNLCLNLEDFYPKYAYKCYACKKNQCMTLGSPILTNLFFLQAQSKVPSVHHKPLSQQQRETLVTSFLTTTTTTYYH